MCDFFVFSNSQFEKELSGRIPPPKLLFFLELLLSNNYRITQKHELHQGCIDYFLSCSTLYKKEH